MSSIEIINTSSLSTRMITRLIESVLEWVPKSDLDGLKYIRCLDHISLGDRGIREWQQKFNPEGFDVCGMYYCESSAFPAYIELYVGTIYRRFPRILMHSSISVYLLAPELAHEIGHHINARQIVSPFLNFGRSGNLTSEDFAEEYGLRLQGRMLKRFKFRFAKWGLRRFASILVNIGVFFLGAKRNALAADFFYSAFTLDRTYKDANTYYWYSKGLPEKPQKNRSPTNKFFP